MHTTRTGHAPAMTAGAARAIAGEWVNDEGVRTPGFAGAVLHGSINWLRDDAEIPSTSDVDVMVVVEADAPPQKPGKFRHHGLLLEVSYLPASEIADPEQVLGNAHLAGSFLHPGILADPTGHLNAVQCEVAAHYAEETWVLRRCMDVEAKMRRPFPPASASWPDQVNAWLFPTGLATHLLLVAGLRNPTVRLRYPAVRDLLASQGRLDVYPSLLQDLGVLDLTPERAEAHLVALERAFAEASRVIRSPFFFAADISEDGYPVAIQGTRDLIAKGDHREAMFWLTAAAVRCQQVFTQDGPELLREHQPAFMALLADLGVQDRADLVARRDAMLGNLPERWTVAQEIIATRRDTSARLG